MTKSLTPKSLTLLAIHGMGEIKADYAEGLHTRLSGKLGSLMDRIAFSPVYYQNVLKPNEDEVWRRVHDDALHYEGLRRFLLFGFADAAGLENRKEMPGSAYEDTQVEIARTLYAARQAMAGDGPVVAIAQSLGGQVLSSYLYDAQVKAAGLRDPVGIWRDIDAFAPRITGGAPLSDADKAFLAGGALASLVTTGCNIPIFVAAHKKMDIIPIAKPTPAFRWLNFYDPDDPLGWPLQPLSDGYGELVQDYRINAGRGLKWLVSWTPLSHMAYWDDDDVVDPLAALIREQL